LFAKKHHVLMRARANLKAITDPDQLGPGVLIRWPAPWVRRLLSARRIALRRSPQITGRRSTGTRPSRRTIRSKQALADYRQSS
jgi:hypothetical protein